MMRYIILFSYIIFAFYSCTTKTSPVTRIPVLVDQKFGYIDTSGKIMIKPRFYAAQNFSEGLAVVRENGLYGFIDEEGKYIIQAQYEYATSFSNNRAQVWNEGKSWFINTKNEKNFLVPSWAFSVSSFRANCAIVTTFRGTHALIDINGKLLTDTTYVNLERLHEKFFIGRMQVKPNEWSECLLDARGKVLIAAGKYQRIYQLGAYGIFCELNGNPEKFDLYNHSIKKIYSGNNSDGNYRLRSSGNYFIDETAQISRGKQKEPIIYEIVFDTAGHFVVENPSVSFIESVPFDNMVIARIKNDSLFTAMDFKGKRMCKTQFRKIVNNSITGNHVIVLTKRNEWMALNGNGSLHKIKNIKSEHVQDIYSNQWGFTVSGKYIGNKFWPGGWITNDLIFKKINIGNNPETLAGFILLKNDGEQCVYNRSGNLIYMYKIDRTKTFLLNIDYRSNSFASVRTKDELKPGKNQHEIFVRYVRGERYSLPIKNTFNDTEVINLTAEIITDSNFITKNFARKIRISNPFKDTLIFQTEDGYLDLSIEAKDTKGNWKTFVNGRTIYGWAVQCPQLLYPGYCWEVTFPEFEGGFKTTARVRLQSHQTDTSGNLIPAKIYYSAPYPVHINKAQLWRDDFFWNESLPWCYSKTVRVSAFYMDYSGG
jgi:hypothetical protein